MNKKQFFVQDFTDFMLRIMAARHDGLALQQLESEILNAAQNTLMSNIQYRTLMNTCLEYLDEWRREDKE